MKFFQHPSFWLIALALAASLMSAAARAAPLAQVGDVFPISADTPEAVTPVLAFNPDTQQYLAVWYNDRPGNDDIRARRVSWDGVLVGQPFYIAAGSGFERVDPDVVYNSKHNEFLVVWQETDNQWGTTSIRAQRVGPTGLLLGGVVVVDSGSGIATLSNPAVAYAFTSDRYLVVWDEVFHPNPPSRSIRARVVAPAGGMPDPAFDVSQGSLSEQRQQPALAYNRSRNEYLVAWQQVVAGDYDVLGRRVTGNGVALQPPSTIIANYIFDDIAPSVAAIPAVLGDGVYLVAWELATAANNHDIYTAQVTADGALGPRGSLAASTRNELMPAVAGNEAAGQFLVAWREENMPPAGFAGIVARHVLPDHTRADDGFLLGGVDALTPAACAGATGDTLVAFSDKEIGASSRDIYGRLEGHRLFTPLIRR